MPSALIIDVDMPVLRAHMSKEEGRAVSEDEVRRWLR
jgi:hypothetical protein